MVTGTWPVGRVGVGSSHSSGEDRLGCDNGPSWGAAGLGTARKGVQRPLKSWSHPRASLTPRRWQQLEPCRIPCLWGQHEPECGVPNLQYQNPDLNPTCASQLPCREGATPPATSKGALKKSVSTPVLQTLGAGNYHQMREGCFRLPKRGAAHSPRKASAKQAQRDPSVHQGQRVCGSSICQAGSTASAPQPALELSFG